MKNGLISERERFVVVDVLRTIALAGIFVANMTFFSGTVQQPLEAFVLADQGTVVASSLATDFSFNTMFSFMFGFGFMMLSSRLADKGGAMGGLSPADDDALLLWCDACASALAWRCADVLRLHGAASAAFFALAGTHAGAAGWSGGVLSLSVLLLLLCLLLGPEAFPPDEQALFSAAEQRIMAQGSYSEIFALNLEEVPVSFSGYLFFSLVLFPMFLLGMAAQKQAFFAYAGAHLRAPRKVCAASLVAAVVLSLPLLVTAQESLPAYLSLMTSGTALCFLFMSGVLLVYERTKGAPFWRILAALGKCSLSCYILQTILGVLLFNGYGLGLYGTVSPRAGIVLALALFAAEIVIANLWLRRFTMGPLEALWRWVTYGARPRFVRG